MGSEMCIRDSCGKVSKPKVIEVLAINEDGNIVSIMDEAWMFQFIPEIGKRG